MLMPRRSPSLWTLFIAAALVLACGGDSGSEPDPDPGPDSPDAPSADVTGTWELSGSTPADPSLGGGTTLETTVELEQEGSVISGTHSNTRKKTLTCITGYGCVYSIDHYAPGPVTGEIEGTSVTLDLSLDGATVRFEGTVAGDESEIDGDGWSAHRPESPPPPPVAAPSELQAEVGEAEDGRTIVDLAWRDNSDNEEGFVGGQACDDGAWEPVVRTPPDATEVRLFGPFPGTECSFLVHAFLHDEATGWMLSDPSDVVTVTVPEGNHPPVVEILQPTDGASFAEGEEVAFVGSATDPENGSLSGNALQWGSSVDGPLGTGEALTRADLSAGTHIIVLSATDSQGAEASTVVQISVEEGAEPPDQDRIAFSSKRDDDVTEMLYVMTPDGGAPAGLTPSGVVRVGGPAWSPDGTGVAFHAVASGSEEWDIFVADADGTNRIRFDGNGRNRDPTWSPDGTQIAFCKTLTASGLISDVLLMLMAADGSDERELLRLGTIDARACSPSWSPDGSLIAFAAEDPETERMRLFAIDPVSEQLYSFQAADALGGDHTEPAWSPDGSSLAFAGEVDGNPDIYVLHETGVTRLTNDAAWEAGPAWSPDGARLAFATQRDGNWEIYVIGLDGTGLTNLTDHPADDLDPAWSP